MEETSAATITAIGGVTVTVLGAVVIAIMKLHPLWKDLQARGRQLKAEEEQRIRREHSELLARAERDLATCREENHRIDERIAVQDVRLRELFEEAAQRRAENQYLQTTVRELRSELDWIRQHLHQRNIRIPVRPGISSEHRALPPEEEI